MSFRSVKPLPVHALYLHIPFCGSVCPFCAFAVMKDNPSKHHSYLALVKKEYKLILDSQLLDFSELKSVYLGGGTPSRLSLSELAVLVNGIKDDLGVKNSIEWSIELNPEDITESFAQGLIELGMSRFSVGVQSFDDLHLKTLKRGHATADSHRTLQIFNKLDVSRVNIDLMFGFPGQRIKSLEADLKQTLDYNIDHVSVYSLTIETGTAFNRDPFWNEWISENESLISDMYELIIETLAASGIVQYEVSNFSRPSCESQQNLVYWHHRNYLGLGVGAHSLIGDYRWGNHRRLVDYKKALDNEELPRDQIEFLDLQMKRDEELMLQLRLKSGLNPSRFIRKYDITNPDHWFAKIEQFHKNGFLQYSSEKLILTTKGMLLADEISAELAAALE